MADDRLADVDGHLHLVLDNMPGALVYTDDELRIVLSNNRFKEMYAVPRELLRPGRPYVDLLRHLAENGYYGEGDVDALVARRVESLRNPLSTPWSPSAWRVCAIPRERASRIMRPMAGGIASCAAGSRAVARSR